MKCGGTCAETRFRLSAKRTIPFKSAGASVHSTTGRRAVHISLQGLHCSCKPVFCSHVTLTGYPLHSLVSPSLLLPCVTVCHHISTGLYIPTFLPDYTVSRPRRVLFVVTLSIIPVSQWKDNLEYVCRWPSVVTCTVNALGAGNGAGCPQALWFLWLFWKMFSKFPGVTQCVTEHHTTCILNTVFMVLLENVFQISRRYTVCN